MKTIRLFAALAALAPCAVLATPITDADFFGSWTRLKFNNCSLVPDDADCSGFQPPIIPILPRSDISFVREVGPPLTLAQPGFATVFAETTYVGPFDTPAIRSSAFAEENGFGLSTIIAYQTYAYDGSDPVTLEFGGILDFSFSGNGFGTNNDVLNGTRPGEGFTSLEVDVFDLAGADYRLLNVGGGDILLVTGGTQLAGTAYNTVGDAVPPPPQPGITTSVPIFSSLTVQPGQNLLIKITFQAAGDRGGYTDAANTFNFDFRNAPDVFFENLTSGTKAAVVALFEQLEVAATGVGPGRSLADKVALAQTYLAVPDVQATCAVLTGFVNQVQAQRGKKLPPALADQLTTDAQAIMAAIGCN